MQKLDAFFAPRNTGGKPRREFLLHGTGGVGKSEVAYKFSEVFEERFVLSSPELVLVKRKRKRI